jgi:hypothetical protein
MFRNMQLLPEISSLDHWDRAIMDGFTLIEELLPARGICYDVSYLTRWTLHQDHFLETDISVLIEN